MGWALVAKFWPLLPPEINCLYRQSYQELLLDWVLCNARFSVLRCPQTHRHCEDLIYWDRNSGSEVV